ncbi:MAG TPA: DnaA/Hda family protein, partial [Candidatus Absconditabacterales bacterium]|nr:DnaA/Hda family protein [Candidatus Absconditabacterales bacterium]
MTSDRPPKELNNIEARLNSRFGNGLVCDIKNPDYETRFAILKEKIKLNDNPLEDDYLEIIAQSIKDNVRELEGALNLFATQQKLLKTFRTKRYLCWSQNTRLQNRFRYFPDSSSK